MNSKDGSNCAVCTSAIKISLKTHAFSFDIRASSEKYFLIDLIDVDVVDVLRFFFGVVSSSPCSDISKNYQEIVIRRLQHSDFEFSYFEKMTPIFGVI